MASEYEFATNAVRGELDANSAPVLFELEIIEALRAGYVSIGGTQFTQAAISHLVCSPNQLNTLTYTLPEVLSSKGGMLAADGMGSLSWIPKRKTFINRVEVMDCHEHILTGVTTSGRATFFITKDGKSTGSPLFSTIYKIQSNISYTVSDVTETAFTSTNSMSSDLKTLQVNCAYVPLGLLRVPTAVPNGTAVTVFITGKPV